MKHLTKLLLAFGLILNFTACQNSDETGKSNGTDSVKTDAGFNSPEEIANAVVTRICNNDYAGIAELIASKDDIEEAVKSSKQNAEMKEKKLQEIDANVKRMLAEIKKGFDEIRGSGESDGIVWSQARYKSSEYSVNNENGFELMRLKAVLEYKGVEYPIEINDLLKTKTGWKLAGSMHYASQTVKEEVDNLRAERLRYNELVMARDKARQEALDCQAARDRVSGGLNKNAACNNLQQKMDKWDALDKEVVAEKNILETMEKEHNGSN